MEHLTLKAATTQVTDEGVFEAVISTETADREQDVVSAEAMVTALKKWNRPLPLAWNHSTAAADIIGSVDPLTAAVKDAEVVVQGQVNLDSDVGKEAWRSFKSRTIGFSFGYMALSSSKREGGGRNLTEVDVFEITATPTPMNNDTRVLSTKAAPELPLAERLLEAVGDEVALKILENPERLAIEDAPDEDPPEDKSAAQDSLPNHDEHRRLFAMATEGIVTAPPPGKAVEPTEIPPTEELKRQFYDLMLETVIGEEFSQ